MIHEQPIYEGSLVTHYGTDKLKIPDISFLTQINLPPTIDLRDSNNVIFLLQNFINEEINRNADNYFGAFLIGSLANGTATNGSDIDLVHIGKHDYRDVAAITYRLKAIFEEMYRIHVDQHSHVISLDQLDDQNLFPLAHNTQRLDQDSIPILSNSLVLERIKSAAGYHVRPPYSGERPYKTKSEETAIHRLNVQADKPLILPWWVQDSLIKTF